MPLQTEITNTFFLPRKIRCGLAYDHVLLRQGLRRILEDEPDIEVVSEARNAAECLRKVHELRPDVVVADVVTFGLPPDEAERLISRESSFTKVVFFSSQNQASAEELLRMIRHTHASRRNDHEVATGQELPSSPTALIKQERALTVREQEVLKLLAEGKTVRAAAEILGLSGKTVDAHKFNLMRKLGIHNKAELVMWAIQKNIVKVPVNF
ncbi:MAG TPA: response regulator transcription factor [Candidatus Acidoferrum sp.]|nr:response regulator transcription factor [Candidatus Acidoferrum sp.]